MAAWNMPARTTRLASASQKYANLRFTEDGTVARATPLKSRPCFLDRAGPRTSSVETFAPLLAHPPAEARDSKQAAIAFALERFSPKFTIGHAIEQS